MKNLKYIFLTVTVGALLTFTSCKKSFFTDANKNPNAPAVVPPSTLLPVVEVSLGYTQSGTFGLFTSLLTQQTEGIARQSQAYYQYIFTSNDIDDPWSNFYTSTMENCYTLIQQADANQQNAYSGIARLLMAYSMQVVVDAWGKVPYSQAFQGVKFLQPAYDDDKTLYATIGTLVDDGITFLNAAPGSIVPGGDDVIYGGDEGEWIKFGHAIKARLAIHQKDAATALTEIGLSFSSNADNAAVTFISSQTNAAPWFQFNQQRTGDVAFGTSSKIGSDVTLADTLQSTGDPRWLIYVDTGFADVNGVGMGAYYGSDNSPVELITYGEMQLMAAEANNRLGNAVAAQAAFTAGITADMQKLGVAAGDITTYLAAHGILSATPATALAQIGVQQWINLYLNPEAWASYRRLGSPNLTPVSGAAVPRRLLYPQTEYSYNASNLEAAYPGQTITLFAPKVFWDN